MIDHALRRLRAHPGMSLAGLLVIATAVGLFTSAVALSSGARQAVESDLGRLGADLLVLRAARLRRSEMALLPRSGTIAQASFAVERPVTLTSGDRRAGTLLLGSDAALLRSRRWRIVEGTAFTADDERRSARVLLLGRATATQLFGTAHGAGRSARLGDEELRVIGILDATASGDQAVAVVPWTTLRQRIAGGDPTEVDAIFARAAGVAAVPRAGRALKALAHCRRANLDERSSAVVAAERILRATRLVAKVVLAFSLGLGAIGITNVLLLSLAERTREFAIAAAVGASPAKLRRQIFTEALLTGLLGAALGAPAGALAPALLGPVTRVPLHPSSTAALWGVGFAITLAVSCSAYPAWKISRLDPTEALQTSE